MEEGEGNRGSGKQHDSPFHVMTKPIGALCNLDCEYCYYLDKKELYSDKQDFRMSEETLEKFIKQYIEAQPDPEVVFSWQGGEPTLRGLDFYRKAVELQSKHAPDDKNIQNVLQTNGTRLDDEWCEFLEENDFRVGISIDGLRELHDEFRQTRVRSPTFDQVMEGLSRLQEHDIEYNVLCVVNSVNSQHPLKVYNFFKDQGVKWIQFIPLVEPRPREDPPEASKEDAGFSRLSSSYPWPESDPVDEKDENYSQVVQEAREASVTDRSVDPVDYGNFMSTIFDEWVREDVGEISVRLFDESLRMGLGGEATFCIFREECGNQIALEHNGDVYACDHFVDPEHKRGNLNREHLAEMLGSEEQRQFGRQKKEGLPERCQECPAQNFCHGGCPKNRIISREDGDLNYLCAGYRHFFSHVQPYLGLFRQARKNGYPLPSVMDAVAELDRRHAS